MRLRDCFTVDIRAKGASNYSFYELLKKLIFDPGYRVVVYYRVAIFLKNVQFAKRICSLLGTLILIRLCRVPGVEIRTQYEIGEGLRIYHPHDIVIGFGSKIGKNVTIYNGVTLGAHTLKAIDKNKDNNSRYPIIENNVTIFTGAKIIGAVTIGDDSIVGANSVVNTSFPQNSVIAGVPARLIRSIK